MNPITPPPLVTILLFFFGVLFSIIGFLLVHVLNDLKSFMKETRQKLDEHCEDFERHAIPHRRSTDRQ